MLTSAKRIKFTNAIRSYSKKYLCGRLNDLDESGTRIMINAFLSEVLGFTPLDEIKTEYMIRSTYADYMIQTKGVRHFLVEVKSLSVALSEKHLRQAINYGANEGVEWALLTNGKDFHLYRIIFSKPIDSRKVFSFDLSKEKDLKECVEELQYLHRDAVLNKGMDKLWNKSSALDPSSIASVLIGSQSIVSSISRELKAKFNSKFSEEEIKSALYKLISTPVDTSTIKLSKPVKKKPSAQKSELITKEPVTT